MILRRTIPRLQRLPQARGWFRAVTGDLPAVADFEWYVWDLKVAFFENVDDPDDAATSTAGGPTAYVNTFLWDFGDGNTSTERHPVHTYAAPATYSVTLTAWNPVGVPATISQNVVVAAVSNHAPFASFTYSISGLVVTFTDTSEDDDGTIASWSWNFGDAATSTSQNPSRTYATDGVFTVTLTVTDDDGATNAVTQTIPVGTAIGNYPKPQDNWPMPGANVQRTSFNTQEVWDGTTKLTARWYTRFEYDPLVYQHNYIPFYYHPILVDDVAYIASSGGIYAIDIALATEGTELWRYPMAMPPGHMPTYHGGYLYIPGTDNRLHVINANTGAFVRSFVAGGKIVSNPLLLDSGNSSATQPIAIFGCRDGQVYAVYAEGAPSPGTEAWSTDLSAPINHCAAYYADHIYIGAEDSKIYKIAIDDGVVATSSATQPGDAFKVFWPVIFHHTDETRVIVPSGTLQRIAMTSTPGVGGPGQIAVLMYTTLGYTNNQLLGKVSTPLLDGSQKYLDASDAVTWLGTTHPTDRTYHNLFADDLADAEVLPWLKTGTGSGPWYPPAIDHLGRLYLWANVRYSNDNIPEGAISRWTPAAPTRLDLLSGVLEASDEPRAFVIGGRYLQQRMMGNRENSTIDLVGFGQTDHNIGMHPQKSGNPGFEYLVPNYRAGGYEDSDIAHDANWESYGGLGGLYGTHGTPGAPIPHRGRLYSIQSNTLVCWSKGNHKPALRKTDITPMDTSAALSPPVQDTAAITAKLAAHVQAMLDDYDTNGVFLRPAYVAYGLAGNEVGLQMASIGDPYSLPADTVYALLRAYPYLSVGQQTDVAAYITALHTAHPIGTREVLPWNGLDDRSFGRTYPARLNISSFSTTVNTRNFQPSNWASTTNVLWSKNPFAWYALWMMHDALGFAAGTLISGAAAQLTSRVVPANTPPDVDLVTAPFLANAFIAGYIGFINLKAAAGSALVNGEQAELDRLMALRRDNLTSVTSFGFDRATTSYSGNYFATTSFKRMRFFGIAFQFKWMVPELYGYLFDEVPSTLNTVVRDFTARNPYWHMRLYPVGYNEIGNTLLDNANLLAQATAQAGIYNQQELAARIDDPAFRLGDLDYIDSLAVALELPVAAGISIDTVGDAVTTYANGTSTESKVTVTVTVTTEATEPWFEYDATVPTGIVAGTGCTVNLIVQAPNATTYTVPMYWVQEWTHTTHTDSLAASANHDHFLPASDPYVGTTHTYKGHFTPSATGDWDYYVEATDANGTDTSTTDTVTIATIGDGAIVNSTTDTRYFEYERSGDVFIAQGYNEPDIYKYANDPTVYGSVTLGTLGTAGISLQRFWMSVMGMFGSYGGPVDPRLPATDPPQNVIRANTTKDGRSFFWQIQSVSTAESFHSNGIVIGITDKQYRLACEESSTYSVIVTYQLSDTITAAGAGDYGLVIKTMTTQPSQANIASNASGTPISSFVTTGDGSWTTLTGTYNTASGQWFLPYIIIGIENGTAVSSPGSDTTNRIYISDIEIRKDGTGPNLFNRFKADMHKYFDQRRAAAMDQVIADAEAEGVYLSMVVLDKNDSILNNLNPNGTIASQTNNINFYGNSTDTDHHGRWLQKQYWRYVQARYGYSTAVHSWELLNEGADVANHYQHAEVMATYINQWTLNRHLVTTSFSLPGLYAGADNPQQDFWNSSDYPVISAGGYTYVTTHDYVDSVDSWWDDSAELAAHLKAVFTPNPGMPVGSGESDWRTGTSPATEIDATTNAVWLHNYLWALIDGDIAFSFPWWISQHLHPSGSDQRSQYGTVRAFLDGLPLNNGEYTPITPDQTNLFVVGQVDATNGRAYVWVQAHGTNPYTWKSVDDGLTITPVTEDVVIAGLTPSADYLVTEYDTATGLATANTDTLTADGSGELVIPASSFASLTGLDSTTAFQIEEDAGGGVDYTLTAAQGSFTLTGQAATLRIDRKVVAATDTFTLTGQAATLLIARRLTAASGSFTLAGQDATLGTASTLDAEPGSFTLTGQDATLLRSYRLVAATGSFALTGQAATFATTRKLSAETGSFALTGQAATLIGPDGEGGASVARSTSMGIGIRIGL